MFNLDPGKMIVIAVVAIILLGPDKLPQFARQVGGAWRTFNDFRRRMESEVRSSVPDLPPTSEIARLARSPSALLAHLSNLPSEDEETEAPDGSLQAPDGAASNGTAEGAADGAATNGTGEGATDAVDGAATVDVRRDETGGGGAGSADGAAGSTDGVHRPNGVDGTNGVAPVGGGVEPAAPTTNGRPVVAPQPADVAVPADPTLN